MIASPCTGGVRRKSSSDVRRGATLESFAAGAENVEARIVDAGGATRTVRCRWLIGCDGARSGVRKGLGLAFEGDQYPMTFMLGDVEWTGPCRAAAATAFTGLLTASSRTP